MTGSIKKKKKGWTCKDELENAFRKAGSNSVAHTNSNL